MGTSHLSPRAGFLSLALLSLGGLARCACEDPPDNPPPPPPLDGFTLTLEEAPASVVRGDAVEATLRFTHPAGTVALLRATRADALGETVVDRPASELGIAGTSGTFTLAIDSRALPFGDAAFRLLLVDADDEVSTEAAFTLAVMGAASGGTAPALSQLQVSPASVTPPGAGATVAPLFTFETTDPDADIATVRVRVDRPDGSVSIRERPAAALGIRNASDRVAAALLPLTNADPVGSYSVTLTLLDANASSSAPATTQLELRADAPVTAPAIASFSPSTGAAGTEVTLTGAGFSPTPDENTLTLDRVPVDVLASTSSTLTVRIPAGASAAPFVLRTVAGTARSAQRFEVPASITVTGDAPSVVVGGTVALHAVVVTSDVRALEWLVDGVVGGGAASGTITSTGVFTAPAALPPGGTVTVAARALGTALAGELALRIHAPESTAAGTTVLAASGGTATADDGTTRIEIPAGALASDTLIEVASLPLTALPAAPAGRVFEGAVEFGPDGLQFQAPATIHVPLLHFLQPGRELALRQYFPGTQTFADDFVVATVEESGTVARAQVSHFSVFVFERLDLGRPSLPAPAISSLEPASGLEGARVPVRLTGTDLSPELDVRVLKDGNPTTDITPGPLFVAGDEAGLLLDIGVLTDLGAGASRVYTLELARPIGAPAQVAFTVQGLAEWTVAAGAEEANPPSGTYSAVDIAGTVRVTGGRLDVTATRRVDISGTIDARGAPGASAAGPVGGSAGPAAGAGGDATERGANASFCQSPTEPGCELGLQRFHVFGVGGEAGQTPSFFDLFADLVEAILDLFACVGSVASGGTLGSACAFLVEDIIEIALDFEEIPSRGERMGRGGAGGARSVDGARVGGGGGGGGGDSDFDVFNPRLEDLGGGGGAGGEPGRPVTVVSGLDIVVIGTVATSGGAGGAGASGEYPGGGGGGGAAGDLALVAARRIVRGPQGVIDGAGGAGGHAGLVHDSGNGKDLRFRAGDGKPGAAHARQSDGRGASDAFVFVPALLDTQVTNRAVFTDVRVQGNTFAAGSVTVTVRGEDAGQVRTTEAAATEDGDFRFNAVLFPGFNTVSALADTDPLKPILDKTVLVIFGDDDGDGLTEADEAFYGTDPDLFDTDGDGISDGLEVATSSPPTEVLREVRLGDLGFPPQYPNQSSPAQLPCVGKCTINDRDQIIASGFDQSASSLHPLLWDPANPVGRDAFPAPTVLGGIDANGDPTHVDSGGRALSINANGVVVGEAFDPSVGRSRAVRWNPSSSLAPTILGDLDSTVSAHDINTAGQIVGTVFDPAGFLGYACLWDADDPTSPPTLLPSAGGAIAHGINDNGTIVGLLVEQATGTPRFAVWDAASPGADPVILGELGAGSVVGRLYDLNDDGVILGDVFDPAISEYVGAVWDPASPSYPNVILLGGIPPSPSFPSPPRQIFPGGMNRSGTVVGQANAAVDVNPGPKPVIWAAATRTAPPAELAQFLFSFAWGINDAFIIVGVGRDEASGTDAALAWASPGEPQVTLRPNATALGLGESGAAYGHGYVDEDGSTRGFLWTITRPAPTLTQLSTSAVDKGATDVTITVTGSGFVYASRVRVDGHSRRTTFVNARQLTVDLTADAGAPGTLEITVFTPGPGGGTTPPLTFTVNDVP